MKCCFVGRALEAESDEILVYKCTSSYLHEYWGENPNLIVSTGFCVFCRDSIRAIGVHFVFGVVVPFARLCRTIVVVLLWLTKWIFIYKAPPPPWNPLLRWKSNTFLTKPRVMSKRWSLLFMDGDFWKKKSITDELDFRKKMDYRWIGFWLLKQKLITDELDFLISMHFSEFPVMDFIAAGVFTGGATCIISAPSSSSLKLGTHFRYRVSSPQTPPPAQLLPSARRRGGGRKPAPIPAQRNAGHPDLPPACVILHPISRCPPGCLEIGCRMMQEGGGGLGGGV